MLKMCVFFHLQYENACTETHQFWYFFKMHADMTAVTIQSNKIV